MNNEITEELVYEALLKILNSPIKQHFPKDGYAACLDCNRYFHHPIVYCPSCGKKIEHVKEMLWKDFVKRMSSCGAGPMNTVESLLYKSLNAGYHDNKERHNHVFAIIQKSVKVRKLL
jgi:hypothetical protein